MELTVTSDVLAALRKEAALAAPNECCGVLLGQNLLGTGCNITALIPAKNVHLTPQTHFEIDPQALLDAHKAARQAPEAQVLGYYHSHPSGCAVPSATDKAMAARDGAIWAIIAGQDVQFWQAAKSNSAIARAKDKGAGDDGASHLTTGLPYRLANR